MRLETLKRFVFHNPDAGGIEQMKKIRVKVRELASLIDGICPESREKATALTNLATVMMNANSAIVQTYPIEPNDLTEEERKTYEL